MKDIELPEPDAWVGMAAEGSIIVSPSERQFFNAYAVFTAEQMRAYARAAVEADRAQRVPDWSHPKVQALIGSDARKRIQIDLLWRILENPNDDFGPSDMEYWDAIHDRLKSSLLASTPAQPAQQEPTFMRQFAAAKKEVEAIRNSPMGASVQEAVLVAQPAPQPVGRKPMTPEQVAETIFEMNGNEPSALFWRDLVSAIERHHGIRE